MPDPSYERTLELRRRAIERSRRRRGAKDGDLKKHCSRCGQNFIGYGESDVCRTCELNGRAA